MSGNLSLGVVGSRMLKFRGFLCPVRIIPEMGGVGCHGAHQASMDQILWFHSKFLLNTALQVEGKEVKPNVGFHRILKDKNHHGYFSL